ncbi:MAG: family 43 glycosylhydrolase [Tepidisphaeraceae bacterium]
MLKRMIVESKPGETLAIAPPFTSAAEIYSGISGPGKTVVGSGRGGYRSGYEGLMYDGPDAKPGWLPLGQYVCTSSAVKAGLLPPLRPIWDVHIRDTVICVGGDGFYYMTGSTGDNIWDRNDGIELWRSSDLQQWDYLGLVWSFERDATWQKQWHTLRNRPVRAVWAPELHYLKHSKRYVLAFSLAGGGGTGILVSATGQAQGPYVSPLRPDGPLTGGIDATLFEDDDGKVYFTWAGGGQIGLLKEDLSGFEIPPRAVEVDKSTAMAADGTHNVPADLMAKREVGFEGASLFKRGGKYYLGGAEFWGGVRYGRYDSVVAIADNIWGPYRQWHEAVPCGGGTNYFQDRQGNWWCGYFGNDEQSPYREKAGLVRIDFAADGRIIIADEQPPFALQPGAPTKWRSQR